MLLTQSEMSATSTRLSKAAREDFKLRGLPNGVAVDLQALVELALHLHETTPFPRLRDDHATSGKNTFPEPKVPARHGLQSVDVCSTKIIRITFDCRNDQKSPKVDNTECAITIMEPEKMGGILSGMVLRMKTVALIAGKDTVSNVQSNLSCTFRKMKDLEERGVIYDRLYGTYFGIAEALETNLAYQIDWAEGVVSERKDNGHESIQDSQWQRSERFKVVKIKFMLSADMASLFAGLNQGGRTDPKKYFCTPALL